MSERCWIVVLAALALVTGCRGDDGAPRPPGTLPTVTIALTGTASSDSIVPTEQPGYIASPPPLPGRTAPDAVSGPLTFSQLRVFAGPTSGIVVLRANVTNTGAEFLNDAAFTWRITDAAGSVLDQGDTTIASLAPSETISVELAGSVQHDDNWTDVAFEFSGTSQ